MSQGNEMTEIQDSKDIPRFQNEQEEAEFWATHSLGEELLNKMSPIPEGVLPPARPRTKPINVRFDSFTLDRLNELAARRNVGYQTLLKQFVTERLYEEEKKEETLPGDRMGETESTEKSPEATEAQKSVKPGDWQAWAYNFVKENEALLRAPDVDEITLSRLAKNSSTPLLRLSGEIRKASDTQGYPAARLQRMLKGYKKLKEFTERTLDLYAEKFGMPEEGTEDDRQGDTQEDPEGSGASVADVRGTLEEAEGVVIDARERFAM